MSDSQPRLNQRWISAMSAHSAGNEERTAAWARLQGERSRSSRRLRRWTVPIVVGLASAAAVGVVFAVSHKSGGGRQNVKTSSAPSFASSTIAPPPTVPLYTAMATVVEQGSKGASLCLGPYFLNDRGPRCGDVPIRNWSWTSLQGVQTSGGTRWGYFKVMGHFDGTQFELTTPPLSVVPSAQGNSTQGSAESRSGCTTPTQGWTVRDPTRVTLAALMGLMATAQSDPAFGGMWVTYLGDPTKDTPLYTVAFTSNLAAHRSSLEAVWGGPLCVTQSRHSIRELNQAGAAATARLSQRRVAVLQSDTDQVVNVIKLKVVLATTQDQAAVNTLVGSGLVELTSALSRVNG